MSCEMSQEMSLKLRKSLILHEEFQKFPYIDTKGNITIGIGYNLSARGLPESFINSQYESDVKYLYDKFNEFDWFNFLNEDRQIVLIDMAFMGWKNFLEFEKMIQALSKQDYRSAAEEMLDSKWAQDVKNRAIDLSNGMRTGVYNP